MEIKQLFDSYNKYTDRLEQFLSKTYTVPEITVVKYNDENSVDISFYHGDTSDTEFTTINLDVETFEKIVS